MASTLSRANAAVNAEASTVCALLNSGYLRLYSGAQPASADTALSGNTLLAELRFSSQAFGSPVAGLAAANTISPVNAAATGTAVFARCFESDGTTVVMDLGVSTSGSDLSINSTSIAQGAQVVVNTLNYQAAK